MAKQLEIRRHTDNDGDVLSSEGVDAALAIGRERLSGRYDLVVTSGAQRATQAAACFLAGLGEPVRHGVVVAAGLRSEREDAWRDAYEQAGSGELDAFRAVAPDLVREEAEVLGAALGSILDRLDDGERALAVGHSPTAEAAVLGLTGRSIAPLGKGDGIVVTLDAGSFTVAPAD